MPELPIISGAQCIAALERRGYYVARTKGSHVRMRCPGRWPVTVPKHDEPRPGHPALHPAHCQHQRRGVRETIVSLKPVSHVSNPPAQRKKAQNLQSIYPSRGWFAFRLMDIFLNRS